MANTLANLTFTTNAFSIIRDALSRINEADYEALGTGDTTYTAASQMASILTTAERKIFLECPSIGNAEEEVTVSANAKTVAVPSSMYGLEIREVRYVNANHPQDDEPIKLVTYHQGINRSGTAQNTIEEEVPRFCYLDRNATNLVFSGNVPVSTTFAVEYRTTPTEYTASDLGSSSVVYSSIPDIFKDVLACRVAWELTQIIPAHSNKKEDARANYADKMAEMERALETNTARNRRSEWLSEWGPRPTQSRRGRYISKRCR